MLIAVHVAAAIYTEFREGGTVISAMFTGVNWHSDEPVDGGAAASSANPGAPVEPGGGH